MHLKHQLTAKQAVFFFSMLHFVVPTFLGCLGALPHATIYMPGVQETFGFLHFFNSIGDSLYCRSGLCSRIYLVYHSSIRITTFQQERSTIEVHPKVSEAPHSRSSIPHPKTDFRKNRIASRGILPWSKCTIASFFRDKIGIPTNLG